MVKNLIKKISSEFLDCLYPENIICLNCGEELKDENFLCKNCLNGLVKIKHACKKCGNIVNSQTEFCDDCKGKQRAFDKAFSPFEYCETAQSLIYKLKYNKEKYIAKVFAQSLLETFLNAGIQDVDIVTCIPLNSNRKRERRFNQAEEISKEFVKELNNKNIRVEENYNIVKRIKNTPTQTKLTKEERKLNLENAFIIDGKKSYFKNKSILIVDDIFTTGATMEEVAKLFKKAHAKNVYCLTVCHTNINRYKENN